MGPARLWAVVIIAAPFGTGMMGAVALPLVVLVALRRAHMAIFRNERYWFTTWRRAWTLGCFAALGGTGELARGESTQLWPPADHASLHKQALQVGYERVRKSLLRQGLRPLYIRPNRVMTDSNHHKAVADNVLDRRFDGWHI